MIELKTKDVEAWMMKMQTLRKESDVYPSNGNDLTPNQNSILAIRAAVALDWFEGELTQDMLDDAHPGEVVAAGERVWEIYREAMTIDPNSSSPLVNI